MQNKRWKILSPDPVKTEALHRELKVNTVLCKLLIERGVETFEQAKNFFRPQLSQLHDPWLMKDMDKAVDRIFTAFDQKEKILVFGDYDVDGTTAVACVYSFLHKHYQPDMVEFYIPHRYREGYGVSKMGIDFAFENGYTLMISLDCGIKSTELIAYAKSLGIDFIVCDHHLPDVILPPAVAILNAKQPGCPYPFKELCGCGVGFKLITALCHKLNLPEQEYLVYLDLVATAIAADIVPMNGENRILAYYGLKKINENPSNGIKALIQLAAPNKPLSITNVVFIIAPRVNAAGRMDDARKAVLMFIEEDYNKALEYAKMLHSDNTERKEMDTLITEEAIAIIQEDQVLINRNTTVVYQPHWHKGVVGIVASRLIEHYYRPTVVLTQSGEIIAGSARSVSGFNLHEAIHACREHLLGYGGHFAAAGMTMLPENLSAFSDLFEKIVTDTIPPELLIPEIRIDAELDFSSITTSFYNILTQMEPFGPDNYRPIFIATKVLDTGYSKILKDQHLRLVVKQDNRTISGIGFNMAEKFPIVQMNKPLDIVFTLEENTWNGNKNLQMKLIDLRISPEEQAHFE